MERMSFKNLRAFTLIELLVVIAIIGVLSAVVLVSLNTARAKGRDAKVKTELVEMRKALEIYYNDNGQYPPGGCDSGSWSSSNTSGCSNTYVGGSFTPKYISALPVPQKNGGYFLYSSRAGDKYQSYKLLYSAPESETIPGYGSSPWSRCSDSCSSGTYCDTSKPATSFYSITAGVVAACSY